MIFFFSLADGGDSFGGFNPSTPPDGLVGLCSKVHVRRSLSDDSRYLLHSQLFIRMQTREFTQLSYVVAYS